jgi:hypothetical protein
MRPFDTCILDSFDRLIIYQTLNQTMQLKTFTNLWRIALLAILQLVFYVTQSNAQVVTIPAANTNSGSSLNRTLSSLYGFTRTAEIYNAPEIGKVGAINAIGFFYNANVLAKASASVPVKIYMKHTTNASANITPNANIVGEIGGATLVYSGNLFDYQVANGSWTTLLLQTPFNYDSVGSNNLEVIVFADYGNTGDGLPESLIRYSTAASGSGYSITASANNAPPTAFGSKSAARDNIQFTFGTASMSYVAANGLIYPSPNVAKGKTTAPIIMVDVEIAGDSIPYSNVTSLTVGSTGTTSLSDISNLKVFYTGNNTGFYTSNQFGSTLNTIGASQAITGNQTLVKGHNYFWITYDVSAIATTGNILDAEITNITVNGNLMLPSITAPVGNRIIRGPLSGTIEIGPTGAYTTLKTAASDISERGISGPVIFELQANYNPALETFPILFNTISGSSAANRVSIRPATSAGPFTISGSDTVAIFDFVGCSYVTIDGRAGGVASTSSLTIENTNIAGSTIRYFNESSNNIIRYVTVKSVCTSANGGNIYVAHTFGPQGNDNNLIEWCELTAGATTPNYLINALGTIATPAQSNSGNTVSNCKLSDHWNATLESIAIKIGNGNSGWSILNNSFYQTATRTSSFVGINYSVYIASATGTGFVVSGNYVGGSQALCGGAPYTMNSTANFRYSGITVTGVGASPASIITGNTVANFSLSTASGSTTTAGLWNGVYAFGAASGAASIIHVTNNIVGSMNSLGSVTVLTSVGGGVTIPIYAGAFGATDTVNITNNKVGGINVSGTGVTIISSINGIFLTGASVTEYLRVEDNIIGNSFPNNIISANPATISTGTIQMVYGISSAAGSSSVYIYVSLKNNTVQNIANNYSGTNTITTTSTAGIHINGTANYQVVNNTVRNVYTRSLGIPALTNSYTNMVVATVAGIRIAASTNDVAVRGNKISNIVHDNNTGNAAIRIAGILGAFSATVNPTNIEISNNLIAGLTTNAANAGSSILGLYLMAGEGNVFNNVIRLGLDTLGNSIQQGYNISGFYQLITAGNGSPVPIYRPVYNFYHNTVYIAGDDVASVNPTSAFTDTANALTAANIQNNVFINTKK